MNKSVELPLVKPVYSTYHLQGTGSAILASNPSIHNWYLNEVMNLTCDQKFFSGFSSPWLNIPQSFWVENPHLQWHSYSMRFLKGHTASLIRAMLDEGYYVYFDKVDDYFVEGKSWYQTRHFGHDGLICGYDQTEQTYSLYAYDSHWLYRKFTTPQKCFHAGENAILDQGEYPNIHALKPRSEAVDFAPETVYQKLNEYLDSSLEKYPPGQLPTVYGIAVQEHIAMYIEKLIDGSILYERMDHRIFRLIWEHKALMLERLQKTEEALMLDHSASQRYAPLVSKANAMRMMYASHHRKRRDSVLPILRENLLGLKNDEQKILTEFTDKMRGSMKK